MACAKNVMIVGGGIGGMTLAVALQRAGVAVHVVEQGRREDQLGTGINLQHNALVALKQAGVLDDCLREGFAWNTVTNRDASGNVMNRVQLPWPDVPGVPGAMGIMRTTLADILARNALAGGVRISYQTTVTRIEQRDDHVEVELSDGRTERADLLVGADGVYSQIRSMVFGEQYKPRYAGQGVWRYTAPRPSTLDGFTLFHAGAGRSVGFLPLSPDICYYFYLETSEEPIRFSQDQLASTFAKRLEPFDASEIQDALARIPEGRHISYRPFDILLMPQPWSRGRVVLLGDAAHSVTPQLTSGGGMAVEGAVVLVEELERFGSVPEALAAYCARRDARVRLVYENSYRICEIEKNRTSEDGSEGTQLMVESFKVLARPY